MSLTTQLSTQYGTYLFMSLSTQLSTQYGTYLFMIHCATTNTILRIGLCVCLDIYLSTLKKYQNLLSLCMSFSVNHINDS